MKRQIILAVVLVAIPGIALAQSSTATSGTTTPMTTAPASKNWPDGRPKAVIPPAARSGGGGIHVGPGSADSTITIKREK